jgi:periplasmic protein CpxP/Spy
MWKSLCSLALSAALAVAGSAAFAQSDSSAQQPAAPATNEQPMQGHHGMSPDKQLAEMTKMLNLTADQQTQLKPILVDRQQQMKRFIRTSP